MTEEGGERICDIILTYCDCDREFGIKLAGKWITVFISVDVDVVVDDFVVS